MIELYRRKEQANALGTRHIADRRSARDRSDHPGSTARKQSGNDACRRPVLKALRETGLLRMTTPRSLGGLETDPVTRALVGRGDRSPRLCCGWTLENPLDWAFFCARLPDEGAEEIYSRGADILIAAQFGRPLKRDVDQRRIPHLRSSAVRQQLL